ncbi:MAG: S-layer homology domain-containing protein, partial [Firmicutes bacterium]|nr:S-layer homology domain-containing protein [Bacillota bacterium]
KSDEAQKAVNALTRAGIIRGVSDTEFAPDAAVTRAEAAALLLRMTAQSDADGNGGFSDVTEDMWYYDTAGASKKYGIISGFEDNTFRGDDRISKVQLISLAARALKNERNVTASETENTYDAPEWAAEEIALALNSGLITENDLSDLNTPISRADAAVILYRLYDRI